MYQTECVNCQSSLTFTEHDAGELIQCEQCGQFFPLPSVTGAVATMDDEIKHLPVESVEDKVVASESRWRWSPPQLALCALLAIAVAAIVFGNLATKILVPVLVLAAINGYRLGGARIMASFAALALAGVSAGPLGKFAEGAFSAVLGTTGVTNRLISVVAIAVVVLVGSGALFLWMASRLVKNKPTWSTADRWSGSLLGAVQGALLVFLATWGVLALDSAAKARLQTDGQVATSNLQAHGIVRLADSVRGGMFGSLAERYNPLAEMKVFSMPSKFLKVVNHPEALAAFTEHPAVQQIKDRPVVAEAMKTLHQDETVKQLIASGDQLSAADLATILSSPATLKLVDESDLMAELRPISAEFEQALEDAVAVADANPNPRTSLAIPAGAISYQIHPPIKRSELTAVPMAKADEASLEEDTQPVDEVKAEKRQRRQQRIRARRTDSTEASLTTFGE